MPNNKHQTIMTVSANNRCIYKEHMSQCEYKDYKVLLNLFL